MIEQSPEVFYVDVLVTNINNNFTTKSVYAEYNETRTIPYLYNPNEYYGAIVQFNIQNTNTPVIVTSIVPNQNNANLTIYEIALEYNGATVFQSIIYQPQNLTIPEPLPPSAYPDGLQNNDESYYSVYSYNYFCSLVNTALQTVYNILRLTNPSLPVDGEPFIKFNSSTQLFFIDCNATLYNQTVTTPINIYFNGPLLHLFSFFPSSTVFIGSRAFELLLLNPTTSTINNNVLTITQELQSINLWTNINSICITTQTIPIIRNQTFSPALYYGGVLNSPNNNSETQSILLEYSVEDSIYTKNIVYNPTAQYKLFELTTEVPLYNLDFKFNYRSTSGILEPISLNSGSSLSVKIGFFKKSKFSLLKNLK